MMIIINTRKPTNGFPRTTKLPNADINLPAEPSPNIAFVEAILEGLGGYDNIVDVTNCATRLRVNVKDETLCKDDPYFKSIGAHGCSANGKSYQVIVGLKVPKVRDDFETLLSQIKATV